MLLAITVALVYTMTIYYCKILWTVYISTPIGMQYAKSFHQRAGNISNLLNRDPLILSIRTTGLSLIVCFSIAIVCRFLHITRLLFFSRGLLGKIVFFGLTLTAVAATFAQMLFQITPWTYAYLATVLPTLLLFSGCFKYAYNIMPELGGLFQNLKKRQETHRNVIHLRSLDHKDDGKLLEFDIVSGLMTGKKIQGDDDIIINGIYSRKNNHDFILYRYAGEFFFQHDDNEIVLNDRMNSDWSKAGRWKRNFVLKQDDKQVLAMRYWNIQIREGVDFFYEMNSLISNNKLLNDEYLSFKENPSEMARELAA